MLFTGDTTCCSLYTTQIGTSLATRFDLLRERKRVDITIIHIYATYKKHNTSKRIRIITQGTAEYTNDEQIATSYVHPGCFINKIRKHQT